MDITNTNDIHINGAGHVRIYVRGKLQAEISCGKCDTRDDLAREVYRARHLVSLGRIVPGLVERLRSIAGLEDHINQTPAAKANAFARGLLEGLEEQLVPCPGDYWGALPKVPPESTNTYRAGWEYGEALARLSRVANEGNAAHRKNAPASEPPNGGKLSDASGRLKIWQSERAWPP